MRRGSLEWSLETVGKLIFYALILVAIIYMSLKLVDIFIHGERDWRAQRNLDLLEDRIEHIDEGPQEAIVNVPDAYFIVGFDKGSDESKLMVENFAGRATTPVNEIYIRRPRDCEGSACLCVERVDVSERTYPGPNGTPVGNTQGMRQAENGRWYFESESVKCIELEQDAVGMGAEKARYERDDEWFSWDPDIVFKPQLVFVENNREYRQVFITSGFGPRAIALSVSNKKLLIDPVCTDAELEENAGCKRESFQDALRGINRVRVTPTQRYDPSLVQGDDLQFPSQPPPP